MNNSMTTSQMEAQMNQEQYERNIPSAPLQPYLDVRPVSTKYSLLPIVDPRKKVNMPMAVQPTYHTNVTFNPGNAGGPWSGYASAVNVESELKNQVFALQNCDRSAYVPNSNSDLYQVRMPISGTMHQPHYMNHSMFFNSTRCDLRCSHEKVPLPASENTNNDMKKGN
jgi:hypothetical protein